MEHVRLRSMSLPYPRWKTVRGVHVRIVSTSHGGCSLSRRQSMFESWKHRPEPTLHGMFETWQRRILTAGAKHVRIASESRRWWQHGRASRKACSNLANVASESEVPHSMFESCQHRNHAASHRKHVQIMPVWQQTMHKSSIPRSDIQRMHCSVWRRRSELTS